VAWVKLPSQKPFSDAPFLPFLEGSQNDGKREDGGGDLLSDLFIIEASNSQKDSENAE